MFYIRRSDGAYASYDGMTLDQITESLAAMGLTGDVVEESEYIEAAQRP